MQTLLYSFKGFLATNRLTVGMGLFFLTAFILDMFSTLLVTAWLGTAVEANPWVRDPETHQFLWTVGLVHGFYWFILGGVGASYVVKQLTGSDFLAAIPFFVLGFGHWEAAVHNMRFVAKPLFWIFQ